jgi:hypothetical protein
MMGMDQFNADIWPPFPAMLAAAFRSPGVDPLWFFPGMGDPAARAKAVCATCPHLVE